MKISSQIIHTVVVATIIFVAFATITFAVGMTSGSMFSCPLMQMEHPVVCPMTAVDHVAGWKLLVAAVLVVVAAVVVYALAKCIFVWYRACAPSYKYKLSSLTYRLHHYLQDAFSSGIIHPKIYA